MEVPPKQSQIRNKTIRLKQNFGEFVDYFLFAVKTPKTLCQLTALLGDACNCTFTRMNDFSGSDDPMRAAFMMAYAQFASPAAAPGAYDEDIDKVNFVVFQNRTTQFDRSKGPLAESRTDDMFAFADEGVLCYAVNASGLVLQRERKLRDFDYFVIIYARKNRGADRFARFFAELPPMPAVRTIEMTDYLYGRAAAANLLKSICHNSERQIGKFSLYEQQMYLGTIPSSIDSRVGCSPYYLAR